MATNYREIGGQLLLHGFVGGPLLAAGVYLLFKADRSGSPGGGFFAAALIVMSGIVMARPLARLFAEPFGSFFYPNARLDGPAPQYSIPQSKKASGLYEEAMAGFQEIARKYPDEVQPWVEMIDICITGLGDPQRANRVFQDGIAALKKETAKEALAVMYRGVKSRLNARPRSAIAPEQAARS